MPMINGIFSFIGVTDIEVAWADGQDAMTHKDGTERKAMAVEAAQELAEDLSSEP